MKMQWKRGGLTQVCTAVAKYEAFLFILQYSYVLDIHVKISSIKEFGNEKESCVINLP